MAPLAADRTPPAPGAPLLACCTAALVGACWLSPTPLRLGTAGALAVAWRVLPLLTRPVLAPTSAVLLLHAGIDVLGYAAPPLAAVLPACLLFLVARLGLPQPAGRNVTTLILTHDAPFTVGPFSWLAGLRAHIGWQRHVSRRAQVGKTAEIYEDTDFHWGLERSNGRRKQPENGELVRSWDRVVVWDDDCPPLDVLEQWRSIADEPADAAVRALSAHAVAGDALSSLANALKDPAAPEELRSAAQGLFASCCRRPPPGAGALSLEYYAKRKERAVASKSEARGHESWDTVTTLAQEDLQSEDAADEDELREEARIIDEGQKVYYRYGPPILISLLHMGLAGGFASARISAVLTATDYLMPRMAAKATSGRMMTQAAADRTFLRLLETNSWNLDVMDRPENLRPPSVDAECVPSMDTAGAGWVSSARVRLLHAHVRLQCARREASSDAINQEDLLATLCAFAIVPLWSLSRMGIELSEQERQDYVAVWRHVGFYMGCHPALLRRTFRDAGTAERFFWSVACHHFIDVTPARLWDAPPPLLGDEMPAGSQTGPALPLLYAMSNRPPSRMTFAANCALARFLIGPSLSTALHLPSYTAWRAVRLRIALFVLILPPLFARVYRQAWGDELRINCQLVLRRLVLWSMKQHGSRKATFRTRATDKSHNADGEEIELDPAEGQRIVKAYRSLLREMGVVLACGGVASGWLAWRVLSAALRQ